jgi:hypothetical protein
MGRGLRWGVLVFLFLLTPVLAETARSEPTGVIPISSTPPVPDPSRTLHEAAAADSTRPLPRKYKKKSAAKASAARKAHKAAKEDKAAVKKADEAGTKSPAKPEEDSSTRPSISSTKSAKAASSGPATSGTVAAKSAREKRAPAASGPRRIGPFSIRGSFGLQTIYDNNIFRYSSVNQNRARTGDFRPGEFDLKTFGDGIISPRLFLILGRRLLGTGETTFRFSYILWQYANNPGKTNQSWGVRLRQPIGGRDFVETGYSYAPMALIRPLGDRAPFDPYSSTPYAFYPFRSARNAFLLAYQRRMTKKLTTRFEGGRVIRYYNQRFIENDNWEWNGTLDLSYSLTSLVKLGARYTYSDVVARGADTPSETRLNSDDGDPSYKRDLYELSLDLSPKRLWLLDTWNVTGQYQAYYFTSEQPYWIDGTHVGRKDEVYAWESTIGTKPIVRQTTLEIGYRFTRRASSSAATSDLEEDKNYHDTRAWLGLSYPF